jgi:CDP-diacylglycerol--serine O-phosphatidyltransferase
MGGLGWRVALPNLVTCVGLVVGTLSIFASLEHRMESAAWLIVLCTLLDKLDGFVARLVHGESEFGVQMDSLSDLVTFCVAPAVFLAGLQQAHPEVLPPVPWAAQWMAAAFVAAGALRLARFNVTTASLGPLIFQGIPTTVAGGTVAILYLTAHKYGFDELYVRWAPFVVLGFALAMVSSIPIPKIHRLKNPFWNALQGLNMLLLYACGLLRMFPEYMLAMVVVYFAVGGGYQWVVVPARARAAARGAA